MVITFPAHTRQVINAIRGAIGRPVYINVDVSSSGCSTCSLDPINNTSTDAFCPSCSGVFWFVTTEDITTSGHIRWAPFDKPQFEPGGIVYNGDCIVTIENTTANLAAIKRSNYIITDGKKLVLDKYTVRGVPALNRIRLFLLEGERD